jgi:HSP20 family protein
MPNETSKRHEQSAKSGSDVEMTHTHRSAAERSMPRRSYTQGHQSASGPFGLMRQMQDEVDRWFNRFGFSGSPANWLTQATGSATEWMPAVDAFQRGNEFVIRADVPGMNRQDLSVEIGDDAVTIRGERKHETDEERDGVYWSERSYGSFCRVVPIPPGAIGESAKASFSNGVLEVVMSAPSQEARRGRKIDISGDKKSA